MNITEKNINVLKDLVEINNDRITGYQKAIKELDGTNPDLAFTYSKMIDESKGLKNDLNAQIVSLGGTVEEKNTIKGSVYHAWMDIRATFTSKEGLTTLELCEFGEDAAQNAYKNALKQDDITIENSKLINEQKSILKSSHDTIKALRDAEKVLS